MTELKNPTPSGNNDPLEKKSTKEIKRDISTLVGMLWMRFKDFIHDISDIKEGLDEEGTKDSIRKNIAVRGSNVWLLMCAIMVASLGLNLGSAAVIIGAMLISPLMSPILGIGLAVGVNDRKMLNASLYNFFIAIFVSLLVSAVYFWLTPITEETSEILNRTKPTFLDVLVAFFGGVAGIVSGSRADKSNAIPGVAIATALLPPLCVSGYGIASGQLYVFLGSFYLFFINSVCIALATYLIVRLLDFQDHNYINPREKRRAQGFIGIFVIVLIIPSFFILMNVLQDVRQRRAAERYVQIFNNDNREVMDHKFSYIKDSDKRDTDTSLIKVYLMGEPLTEQAIEEYRAKMPEYGLNKSQLQVLQDVVAAEDIVDLKRQIHDVESYMQTVNANNAKDEINKLTQQVDSLKKAEETFKVLQEEIRMLFPEAKSLSFSVVDKSIDDSTSLEMPTLMIDWEKNYPRNNRRDAEKRLYNWIWQKMELDTLQVVNY